MADNVTILRSGYEAFAKGDVATVLGLFDAKVEWNEAEHVTYWTGTPFLGPQAVVNGVFARIPLDAQVAHVWDFRDGKVVRFQQYTDTWQFAQVTGITPKS